MQNFEVPNNNNDESLSRQKIMSTQVIICDPPVVKYVGYGGRRRRQCGREITRRGSLKLLMEKIMKIL